MKKKLTERKENNLRALVAVLIIATLNCLFFLLIRNEVMTNRIMILDKFEKIEENSFKIDELEALVESLTRQADSLKKRVDEHR